MIKKEVTDTLFLLEKEDVEKAVSAALGRDVEAGELDVVLITHLCMDDIEMGDFNLIYCYCEFYIDGELILDEDDTPPLYDEIIENSHFYYSDDEIFAFDTSEFRSYRREMDVQ